MAANSAGSSTSRSGRESDIVRPGVLRSCDAVCNSCPAEVAVVGIRWGVRDRYEPAVPRGCTDFVCSSYQSARSRDADASGGYPQTGRWTDLLGIDAPHGATMRLNTET